MGSFLPLIALSFSVASAPHETEVQLMATGGEIAVNPRYPDTEALEIHGGLKRLPEFGSIRQGNTPRQHLMPLIGEDNVK